MSSPHLFTVVLEDYYQVGAFRDVVDRRHWYRFESRLERSAERVLALLADADAQATFFVLGSVAEQMPELVRRIADAGHEIGDRGFLHQSAATLEPSEFVEDLLRGREAVARASGTVVYGHRCCDWLPHDASPQLAAIAMQGYHYDSSVRTLGISTADRRARAVPNVREWHGKSLQELPVSSVALGPLLIPAAGGAWLRHLPVSFLRQAVQRAAQLDVPFVSCVHSWELDSDQPRITSSAVTRLRHYRNLDRMTERLQALLGAAPTFSCAAWLDLKAEQPASAVSTVGSRDEITSPTPIHVTVSDMPSAPTRRGVLSIVVPCFNEAEGIGYLERTLARVTTELSTLYELEFVFVDDGSRDDTWRLLRERFGARPDCRVVQHARNRGVSAAIRTGVEAARHPIVASIDADCTYDPHELQRMVPLLEPDVAVVTASPYHPHGGVKNVPAWRLVLSRGLSQLYRPLVHNRIHTVTSCCRVYRRDVVLTIPTQFDDYRGIAEWLIRIDHAGGRIVEHPTVLEGRLLGTSKMNTVRSIVGHVGLLSRLIHRRLTGRTDHLAAPPPGAPTESATNRTLAHPATI